MNAKAVGRWGGYKPVAEATSMVQEVLQVVVRLQPAVQSPNELVNSPVKRVTAELIGTLNQRQQVLDGDVGLLLKQYLEPLLDCVCSLHILHAHIACTHSNSHAMPCH